MALSWMLVLRHSFVLVQALGFARELDDACGVIVSGLGFRVSGSGPVLARALREVAKSQHAGPFKVAKN